MRLARMTRLRGLAGAEPVVAAEAAAVLGEDIACDDSVVLVGRALRRGTSVRRVRGSGTGGSSLVATASLYAGPRRRTSRTRRTVRTLRRTADATRAARAARARWPPRPRPPHGPCPLWSRGGRRGRGPAVRRPA